MQLDSPAIKGFSQPNQRLILLSVLGICLFLSLASFKIMRNLEQTRFEYEFEQLARNQANQIIKNFNNYQNAIQFIGSFLENTVGATRKEFKGVAKNILQTYPGMQAVSWNLRIRDNQRPVYEKAGRKEGFQNFQFTEKDPQGNLIHAAARPEYVIVYYIEPLIGNEAALGYDIASNNTRLASIEQARNSGTITITEKINLVQGKKKQAAILILFPIYKHGVSLNTQAARRIYLEGFSVGVLKIDEVFKETLFKDSLERMSIALIDETAEKGKQLLYYATVDNTVPPTDIDRLEAGFHWKTKFDMGGRQWGIIVEPSPLFLDSQRFLQSWIVLFAMVLFSLFLLYYLQKTFGYTQNLEKEVSDRKQTELELQKSLDKIKTLQGILPLCSYCKKIRNDSGYWEQVDVYICKHSEADISHAICQSCLKKHFPAEYDAIYSQKD